MFTLIENGELYAPERMGRQSILLARDKIVKVGNLGEAELQTQGISYSLVDASGCYVVPGFIDPHSHINGVRDNTTSTGRTSGVSMLQLVRNGITTVVGCPAVEDTADDLPALLERANRLSADGLTTYVYSSGVQWPLSAAALDSVDSLVQVDRVIGLGAVPLPAAGAHQPAPLEMARLVSEAYAHGSQVGKAGVVQFFIGPDESDLGPLHRMLDDYPVPAKSIYPTHTNHKRSLFDDAIRLTARGAYADMYANGQVLTEWIDYYINTGGAPERLTVSSDSYAEDKPITFYRHFAESIRSHGVPPDCILPFFTQNAATALNLKSKGWLGVGADADLLIIDRDTLEIVHVYAMGRQLVRYGEIVAEEAAA